MVKKITGPKGATFGERCGKPRVHNLFHYQQVVRGVFHGVCVAVAFDFAFRFNP